MTLRRFPKTSVKTALGVKLESWHTSSWADQASQDEQDLIGNQMVHNQIWIERLRTFRKGKTTWDCSAS